MRAVLALLYLLAPAALVGWLLWCQTWDQPSDEGMQAGKELDLRRSSQGACKGRITARAIDNISASIPPPTELQAPVPRIVRLFENCKERIQTDGGEAVLPYLNAALAAIEAGYGRASVPFVSALTQIVVLLANNGRLDLAHPYSERAVSAAREVYGPNHRETAIVLHTHATLLINMNNGEYTESAIPFLREARAIRQRVLGPDHEETAAAGDSLAEMLLLKWESSDDPSREGLLTEAESLAAHAFSAFRERRDPGDVELIQARALVGRIAHAKGEYEKAAAHLGAALRENDEFQPLFCIFTGDACERYADTLRKLGREEEADSVERQMKGLPALLMKKGGG